MYISLSLLSDTRAALDAALLLVTCAMARGMLRFTYNSMRRMHKMRA